MSPPTGNGGFTDQQSAQYAMVPMVRTSSSDSASSPNPHGNVTVALGHLGGLDQTSISARWRSRSMSVPNVSCVGGVAGA